MKKIAFYSVLASLLVFSCSRKENNVSIFVYSLDKDSVKNMFLDIDKKGLVYSFDYSQTKDSINNLSLRYNPKKEVLIYDLDTFFSIKNAFNSKSYEFKMYQTKEIKSHKRTLVFNTDYGLFATLAYGADFLFLKDSISKSDSNIIFKGIILELNKINID
tara:strand:- start:1488 stop:1967 length:480 start_codon:yes stop_codon:yes gene_type:complete